MDYDRVFEIALGILMALAIGWVLLKYSLVLEKHIKKYENGYTLPVEL